MKSKRVISITVIVLLLGQVLFSEETSEESQEKALDSVRSISRILKTKPTKEGSETLLANLKMIRKYPSQSVPLIIRKVVDSNEELDTRLEFSRIACACISEYRVPVETGILIGALRQEKNKEVKKSLLRVLGEARNRKTTLDIIPYTQSEEEDIRAISTAALGKIVDKRALPVLEDLAKHDLSYQVRIFAIRGVSKFRNETSATNAIIEVFRREYERTQDDVPEGTPFGFDKELVLMATIRSLGENGNPESIPFLISVLEGENYPQDVRINAIIALGELGAIEAEAILVDILYHKSGGMRIHSAEVLKSLFGTKYLDDFIRIHHEEEDAFVEMRLQQVIDSLAGGDK